MGLWNDPILFFNDIPSPNPPEFAHFFAIFIDVDVSTGG
jgi:hypothetical protein